MSCECIICSHRVYNKNNRYIFYQTCNCFFNNIHDECLAKWIDLKGTCILCHKTLQYKISYQPFREVNNDNVEHFSLFKKIFKCCYR